MTKRLAYWQQLLVRQLNYNSSGLALILRCARVHTTFTYDGLNRVTQMGYSDSTPTAHYYYDSQTLPGGALVTRTVTQREDCWR